LNKKDVTKDGVDGSEVSISAERNATAAGMEAFGGPMGHDRGFGAEAVASGTLTMGNCGS